jgi:non-ribosomal peptide synthase protein (TIGR01720 family)
MVPGVVMELESLPLTANGKVDRRALPEPEARGGGTESQLEMTAAEEVLAGVWGEVLGVEAVGVEDNFFDLGGDSILSIQVAAKATRAGVKIAPMQLFQYQTVRELARVAEGAQAVVSEQGIVSGDAPLLPIQHWFFEHPLRHPHHFNQAVLLEAREPLQPDPLRRAVAALLSHHDALRLRFARSESGWRQWHAAPDADLPFSHVTLGATTAEWAAAVERYCAQAQSSFDLAEGPVVRVALIEGAGGQRLLVAAHHLVVDGVSWRVVLEDLRRGYEQAAAGEEVKLGAKTTSYKRWGEGLVEYARGEGMEAEAEYWLASGREAATPLPVDLDGGENLESSARTVTAWLAPEETEKLLREVPATYRTQINDVLLSALAQTFAAWTGETKLLVELEGHGREGIIENVDLTRTVGWFTSFYPVLLDITGNRTAASALAAVKEQLRQVPHHGIGYGLLRYLHPDPQIARRIRALPQAEVSFNYLGQFDQMLAETKFTQARESYGASESPSDAEHKSRGRLISVNGMVSEGRLHLVWSYSENLHRRETVERLAEGFMDAIRKLIAPDAGQEETAYTASDFADFDWNQQELDDIAAVLGKVKK